MEGIISEWSKKKGSAGIPVSENRILSFFILTTFPHHHIYRQPEGESLKTIMQRYMDQRQQKQNLLKTLHQLVLDTHGTKDELELFKIIEQFRLFIDKQYSQHFYNPSAAVSMSYACRGVARIAGHLEYINHRMREDKELNSNLQTFRIPIVLLDLLYTYFIFHPEPCRNNHCSALIHLCCRILEWFVISNEEYRFYVKTSPALLMMFLSLLETHSFNIRLVRSICGALSFFLAFGNYSREVSATLHGHQVLRKLMQMAMKTPTLTDICLLLYPLIHLTYYEHSSRDIWRIDGAMVFIIKTMKRVIDDGEKPRVEYAVYAPLELFEQVTIEPLIGENPILEKLFLHPDADISATLVNGLKSTDQRIICCSSRILTRILKYSIPHREKLQEMEGIVELLQKVSLISDCKRHAEEAIKTLTVPNYYNWYYY